MKGRRKFMNSIINSFRDMLEDLISDKRTIIKILLVIFILMLALVFRICDSDPEQPELLLPEESSAESDNGSEPAPASEYYIDISGAVANPGIYKVDSETRLFEVVEMAGGTTDKADTDAINQAAFVQDAQKIIIPEISAANTGDTKETDTVYTAPTETEYSYRDGCVNINTASKEELKKLDGIGDVLADRIIEYREGMIFKEISDIKKVKGIGDSIYGKIKEKITI